MFCIEVQLFLFQENNLVDPVEDAKSLFNSLQFFANLSETWSIGRMILMFIFILTAQYVGGDILQIIGQSMSLRNYRHVVRLSCAPHTCLALQFVLFVLAIVQVLARRWCLHPSS